MTKKKYTKYTEEEWEEIKQYYLDNDISIQKISEKYNIYKGLVAKKLKGLKTPPKIQEYTDEEWELIKKDFIENNLSLKEVSIKYKAGNKIVINKLKGLKNLKKGDKFNQMEFVRYTNKRSYNHSKIGIFNCDCGNTVEEWVSKVRNGYVKSCGCLRQKEVNIGDKFNMLTIVKEIPLEDRVLYAGRGRLFKCMCDCGNEHVVALSQLITNKTKSCGCWRSRSNNACRDKTPEWYSYSAMKTRCLNPNATGYENYGGRGITICNEWLGDYGFVNFLEYMGKRPEGTTLDRKDVNGNYEPGNVRWATKVEQENNKRKSRKI